MASICLSQRLLLILVECGQEKVNPCRQAFPVQRHFSTSNVHLLVGISVSFDNGTMMIRALLGVKMLGANGNGMDSSSSALSIFTLQCMKGPELHCCHQSLSKGKLPLR